MWFNAIGPTTSYDGVVITSFRSWYGKAAWSFITYSLTGRQPYSFHFTLLSFPLCLALLFLLAWLELFWILFLLSVDENILSQLFQCDLAANSAAYRPNRPALHFSPNDPIGSRQNWRPSWKVSINNRRTAIIFIRFLAYFPEVNISSTSLSSIIWKYWKTFHQHPEKFKDFSACKVVLAANHQHPEMFKDFFACKIVLAANRLHPEMFKAFFACKIVLAANHQHPEIFKDFFACKIVLAANHRQPENIQTLFRLQNCFSRKSSTISRKYSKTF